MKKRCYECGEKKELSEFYRNNKAKDGREVRCKACRRLKKVMPLAPKDIPLTKRCRRCGVEKKLSKFYKEKKSRDGHHSWCKVCSCAYQAPALLTKDVPLKKQCTKCKVTKLLEEFPKQLTAKDRHASQCKACKNEITKQRRATPAGRLTQRKSQLKRSFNITLTDYEKMFEAQSGRCAICGTKKPGKRNQHFSVDHNHTTGEVRGLLCYKCNTGLGMFNDNPILTSAATKYLQKDA